MGCGVCFLTSARAGEASAPGVPMALVAQRQRGGERGGQVTGQLALRVLEHKPQHLEHGLERLGAPVRRRTLYTSVRLVDRNS
jgi:hypothetical protein